MDPQVLNDIPKNIMLASEADTKVQNALHLFNRSGKPGAGTYFNRYLPLHNVLNNLRLQLAKILRNIKQQIGVPAHGLDENTFNSLPVLYNLLINLSTQPGTQYDNQLSALAQQIHKCYNSLDQMQYQILVSLLGQNATTQNRNQR